MLNNLTNFFNLIRSRRIKQQLEPGDLIAVGTQVSRRVGEYKPTAIKFEDLQAQLGSGNLLPYKVYTALLNQSGTDDPVATVLENTIGNIVWTRDSTGIYYGTLNGVFTENKTWFSFVTNSNSVSTDESIAIYRDTVNAIHIQTGIGTTETDGRLYNTSIEIRVYN